MAFVHGFMQTQNWLLRVSPGLLPLAALLYSLLSSWHCSLMCGPLAFSEKRSQLHRFLLFRIGAYTLGGVVMGLAGEWLKESLEFQVFNVLAFFVFCAMTALFVLPQLIPGLPKFSLYGVLSPLLRRLSSPGLRGFLLAAVPCHLLAFYYGLAALTGSPLWGAALLFGHGVMTTPALAYAWQFTARLTRAPTLLRGTLRVLMVTLIVVNLCYFAGRIFYPVEQVQDHLLFCL